MGTDSEKSPILIIIQELLFTNVRLWDIYQLKIRKCSKYGTTVNLNRICQ